MKLHLNAKGQSQLTFVNGSDLVDEYTLFKGKSLVRTLAIPNQTRFDKTKDMISDLIVQSFELKSKRWDGTTQMAKRNILRADQPSP